LYDPDVDADRHDGGRVVAWRPPVPGIAEVFHAHVVDYRYPLHCHDTWAVLIVDSGAIRYDLDTRQHDAVGDTVTILPPGVVHNGSPAERYGHFRKRELYLDADFLPASLIGAAVDGSALVDRPLRTALSDLHARLADPDPLDVEARLALVADRLRRRLRAGPAAPEPEPALAERLRGYLDDRVTAKVVLADAAATLDRSVPHLIRSFTRRYGLSPYAYLTGRRIDLARRQLLLGLPAAEVATAVGFHDQAHLTRHFRRHVSVPPARFAASHRYRPD
jgi:AraC-like DNA-binding protein